MGSMIPALIAFTAAVLVGYGSHFLAEDYRRFREGKAIAAALAGELSSIILSFPELLPNLVSMKILLDRNMKIALPEMPDQISPIFEKCADKVGLLGVDSAGDIAFVYDQIRAFRTSFQLLSKQHENMGSAWSGLLVGRCLSLIETNKPIAEALVFKLRVHSESSYLRLLPSWKVLVAGVTFLGVSLLVGSVFGLMVASRY